MIYKETTTATLGHVRWYDEEGPVYPCRCGETHRGPYAAYDYGHHECFHSPPLLLLHDPDQALCPDCGRSWQIEQDSGRGFTDGAD